MSDSALFVIKEDPEKVTLIERPVWRVETATGELIALCLNRNDALHVSAALNDFASSV